MHAAGSLSRDSCGSIRVGKSESSSLSSAEAGHWRYESSWETMQRYELKLRFLGERRRQMAGVSTFLCDGPGQWPRSRINTDWYDQPDME